MMLLTVSDVVLRAVSNRPIRGTFEIVELLLACAFFLALPAVFLRDEHLVVDVVDPLAPRWVPRLRRFAEVIAIPVLALMAWEGFKAARENEEQQQQHPERGDQANAHASSSCRISIHTAAIAPPIRPISTGIQYQRR